MKSLLETVYLRSPLILQQIMVTLKGYALEKERRGGEYRVLLGEVLRRNDWTRKEFLSFQTKELKNIIRLAFNFVPYYRGLYSKMGFSAESIRSLEDLPLLPILNKDEVRQNPLAFVDERMARGKLLEMHTTGTTGTPLRIYTNEQARRWNYAFYDCYLRSVGIHSTDKRATFGGRIIIHPDRKDPPFWRSSFFQKNLLFSSYHLTDKNLSSYFEKLREYQPSLIESYPSSLYVLAKYILDHRKVGEISPKLIVTSGETLFEEHRKALEEAFQCRVRDQYGCVEMSVFVAQCEEGHYHYRPDFSAVEIMKDNGEPARPGEMGEILCTGFINKVMPLIRYRVGDVGSLSGEICSCGLNTPYFEKVIGRTDDFIVTPDGRYVGRLSPVLKGFPVKEAQYFQKRRNLVVVRLVKGDGFNNQTCQSLISELEKRLGKSVQVEIELVDEIQRGPGGKLKTVFSEISGGVCFYGSGREE